MEMMKLGARLATGTQVVLEKAEGMLGGKIQEGSVVPGSESGDNDEVDDVSCTIQEVLSRYANQPASTSEGLQEGYKAMSRNLNSAAQTILAVPMEVYERSGDDVSDLLIFMSEHEDMHWRPQTDKIGTFTSGGKGSPYRCAETDDRS